MTGIVVLPLDHKATLLNERLVISKSERFNAGNDGVLAQFRCVAKIGALAGCQGKTE
jgi:hypothetical protein